MNAKPIAFLFLARVNFLKESVMNNMLSSVSEDVSTHQEITGGFIALGQRGESCFAWSRIMKAVVELTPAAFTARKLKACFGALWCNMFYMVYPEEGEPYFDHQALADDIQEQCQRIGRYRDSKQREAGAWLSADGGLVINSAAVWRNDGQSVERVGDDGYVYPDDNDLDLSADDVPATPEEVLEVEQAFDSWDWSDMAAAAHILGWVACSVFAGALSCRPHLFVTARAGTGKSLLSRAIGAIFGNGVVRPTGSLTQAGIMQKLKGRAVPCIVDETEAGQSAQQSTLAALDVARWSYSMSEHEDGVLRGTAAGKALGYRAFSPFLFLGVNVPKLGHADQTRAVVLEMQNQKPGANGVVPRLLSDERYCAEVGRKLRRLAVLRWPTFQAALVLFRQGIIGQGGSTRMADTLGSLLAGYWCFKSAAVPSSKDVSTLVECLQLPVHIEAFGESDELRCLDVLLYSKVIVPVAEWNGEMVRSMTVAEAIRQYCAEPEAQRRLESVLQNYGMRVLDDDGVWKVAVACSSSHKELLKMFSGSPWKKGNWSLLLRRLTGGAGSTQRLAGRSCKVTLFNVPSDLLGLPGASSSTSGAGGVSASETRLAA